jgi:hypothetical protein
MEPNKFVPPNLHAPRHRVKAIDYLSYPNKDRYGFFASLKEQHPQLSAYSNREIANWIKECNRLLAQEVVSNRQGVKLPEGLGGVVTGLCKLTAKTANNNIDYTTSKRLGVIVPHRNLHTDGYTAKVFHVSKISGCMFKPCRALSRAVSTAIKAEGSYSKYIVFTTKQHVTELFQKPKISKTSIKEIRSEKIKKRLLDSHDEFRME